MSFGYARRKLALGMVQCNPVVVWIQLRMIAIVQFRAVNRLCEADACVLVIATRNWELACTGDGRQL